MRIFKIFVTIMLSLLVSHSECLSYGSSKNKNNTYDIFTCCSEVFGSCRTSCENLSLVQLATSDPGGRDFKLGEVKRFCPSMQIEFWACLNRTLKAVARGTQWSGRRCCALAMSPRCQNVCATSSSKEQLSFGCRQSDEQNMFSCFERQEFGDQCCGSARTSECLQACRSVFEHRSPSKEVRRQLDEECDGNSSNFKVLQCVKNFIDLTPINNSRQYLPCCDYSKVDTCKASCKHILTVSDTTQDMISELEFSGCGPPLPYDPLWQCFLSAERKIFVPASPNEGSQINQVGIDSAKLHCCHKAVAPKCRQLCIQAFSNDWNTARANFDVDCLMQVNEMDLRRCIDEVEEPCELGCDGLSFCTNFNNRPTELFRSCHIHADRAAKSDVALWQQMGSLSLPGFNLPIKNISKCSPETWRAIACTLQIKPCTTGSHMNQICREDCYEVLSKCMDWTRLQGGHTAASLCSKFSPDSEDVPCISLKPYLEPSDIPVNTGGHHKLTSPCKGHPCNATDVCLPFRNGSIGYQCVPGCALGEGSNYWVPFGAYVRIPAGSPNNGCLKICRCGASGKIENCQPLPCISYDACNLAGRRFDHATWFYVECNICSCFAGEIICTKKQCKIPGISDHSYTSLPCNCPPHYVPVCGRNGNTYHSACVAKCTGLQDADIEFGACKSRNPCKEGAYNCPLGTRCIEDRKVCLSVMHRPCLQYQCVNTTTNCSNSDEPPACDTDNKTHKTACHLLQARATFSHFGSCFKECSRLASVCGINGVTYRDECEAWSDYSLVDYHGECREVGLLANDMGARCKHIKCPKKLAKHCQGIVPPGACCPICSGAFRVVFSRKQIDRALYALRGKNVKILTLKNILKALDDLIQITECQLSGFLTMETDLFLAVQSREKFPTAIQIDACAKEASKIVALIATQSHRVTSNPALSALTVANMVLPSTESNSSQPVVSQLLYFSVLYVFIYYLFIS